MPGSQRISEFALEKIGVMEAELALNDPFEGISIQKVTPDREGLSVTVQAGNAKPGLKGNLILDAYREVAANPAASIRQSRRQPMGTLPAVPFEVVDPVAQGK
jgi:hypothetical protein